MGAARPVPRPQENHMEIRVKTHHLPGPARAKEYAMEKFARLAKYHPALREVEVTFKENGLNMECDALLYLDKRDPQIICTSAGDLHSAVDIAVERCERQLVRVKEKRRTSISERRRAFRQGNADASPESAAAPRAAPVDDDDLADASQYVDEYGDADSDSEEDDEV